MYKKLPSFLFQFSAACLMCCVVLMFLDTDKLVGLIYPLLFIPYSLLVYTANLLFLRKTREISSVAILNGVFIGSAMAVIFFAARLHSFMPLLYALLFILWITGIAFVNASRGLSVNILMLCVEISMIMLVIFTAFCAVNEFPTVVYVLPVAACSAAIIAITMRRMDSKPSLRSAGFLAAVFALIFVLLWIMVSFVAAPAGGGIVAVWHFIKSVVLYIGELLVSFLSFIAELFPATDAELPPPDTSVSMSIAGEEVAAKGSSAILYIFVLAIIAAGIVLLYKLRHIKIKTTASKTYNSKTVSRPTFKTALSRLFGKIKQRISLELRLFRERKTPGAVLIRLIRVCRNSALRKQAGETASEFLNRLKEYAGENERLRTDIEDLIPLTERAVFSNRSENINIPDARYIVMCVRLFAVKNEIISFVKGFKKHKHKGGAPPKVNA